MEVAVPGASLTLYLLFIRRGNPPRAYTHIFTFNKKTNSSSMASNAVPTLGEEAPSIRGVLLNEQLHVEGNQGNNGYQAPVVAAATIEDPELRPQADPLPCKRGEIGYCEDIHGEYAVPSGQQEDILLPARHPADRDHSPPTPTFTPLSNSNEEISVQSPPTPETAATTAPLRSPVPDNHSEHSLSKRTFLSLFKPDSISSIRIGGISFQTFSTLLIQLLALSATIAGWVISAKRLPNLAYTSNSPMSANSTEVFIHVTFGIVTVMQLVFLERTIFRVRAERFAYKHPSGVLPTHQRGGRARVTAATMAFAPWNRPPLPTYAAALAQNGFGTGDVEDNIIAVPPPPAYGHTRGSTLLLTGFMSENLRAQRVRERVRSDGRVLSDRDRNSWVSVGYSVEEGRSRPVSYKSCDSAWEHTLDAQRALRLEETLSRLEEGGRRSRIASDVDGGRQHGEGGVRR